MSDEARIFEARRYARGAGIMDMEVRELLGALAAQVEQLRERNQRLERELAAVDKALPPWEPPLGETAIGRVQTILNLKADRERNQRLEAVAAAARPYFSWEGGASEALRQTIIALDAEEPEIDYLGPDPNDMDGERWGPLALDAEEHGESPLTGTPYDGQQPEEDLTPHKETRTSDS